MAVKDLSESCRIALALYGHYVTLGLDQKVDQQAQHIKDTFGIDAEEYLSDPEIGHLEDLLFDME